MPRAGLTPQAVVSTAAELADADGPGGVDALTLARLADRLGVAVPSLYKHVPGLAGVRSGVAVLAASELAEAVAAAAVGRARADGVRAIAAAYRTYAHAHPGRYATLLRAPDPGDEEHEAASAAVLRPILAVLAGYGLAGDEAVDVVRALRSALHGFVSLEAAGGFGMPRDVDRSFDALIALITDALDRRSPG